MLVTLIALTGLGTLGLITVMSVQTGIAASSTDRAHAIALLAAESGAHVGIDYLRNQAYSSTAWFSANIRANNFPAETPPALRGNERLPGQSGNVFSSQLRAWYRVTVFNNENDYNFQEDKGGYPKDSDGRVFLESVGHGPNGATATVVVELQGLPAPTFVNGVPSAAPANLNGIAILSWREVE